VCSSDLTIVFGNNGGGLSGPSPAVSLTSPLPYNPTVAQLTNVLAGLSNVGAGNVSVVQQVAGIAPNAGSPYLITFAPGVAALINSFTATPGGGVSANITTSGGGNPSLLDDVSGGGVSGNATLTVIGTSGSDNFNSDGANSRFGYSSTGLFGINLGGATAGTFTLSVNTGTLTTTAALAFNATAAQVQAALRVLGNVGATGVTVTGNAGGPFLATFASSVAVQAMTINSALLTGTTSTPATTNISASSADGLQFSNVANVVYVDSGGTDTITASSGTTTITQTGNDTLTVNSGATATVNTQNASSLNATNNGALTINAGSANPTYVVSGTGTTTMNLSSGTDGVTLNGTGTTNINVPSTQYNVALNAPTAGTFTLSVTTVGTGGSTQTTAALAFGATAAQIQTALQALSNVGSSATVTGAGPFVVTFTAAEANILSITTPLVINSSLTGTTSAPSVTGVAPTAGTANVKVNNTATANINTLASSEIVNSTTPVGKFAVALSAPTAGNFTLVVNTGTLATTTALPFNASAAAVQIAIQALANVGTGNATVSLTGTTYTVSFAGAVANVLAAVNPLVIGVSTLTGGGARTVTAAGGGTANINTGTGTPTINIVGGGTNNITPGTGTPALTVNGGTATIVANTGTGFRKVSFSSVAVGAGASLVLAANTTHANRSVLFVPQSGLSINATGKIDVNDNDVVLKGGGTINAAQNLLITGFAGGLWNGNGITSSKAATSGSTALGFATGNELFGGAGTFDGQAVAGADVIIKYTYYGDADMNGQVNADDYSLADIGNGTVGTSEWLIGDMNYDKRTDPDDYSLLDIFVGYGTAGNPNPAL